MLVSFRVVTLLAVSVGCEWFGIFDFVCSLICLICFVLLYLLWLLIDFFVVLFDCFNLLGFNGCLGLMLVTVGRVYYFVSF